MVCAQSGQLAAALGSPEPDIARGVPTDHDGWTAGHWAQVSWVLESRTIGAAEIVWRHHPAPQTPIKATYRAVEVSSFDIISRMRNFCTFPVTVIGYSSTNRT